MLKCCFTGLRPQKLSFSENSEIYKLILKKLDQILKQLINAYHVNYFISGMALGWDTWCAKEILVLKNEYPEIILECALPCKNQDKYWNISDKISYQEVLSHSDKVTYIQHNFSYNGIMERNRYMVDCSRYVIALWDGQSGGTEKTLRYAIDQNKRIIVLNPIDLKISTKNGK